MRSRSARAARTSCALWPSESEIASSTLRLATGLALSSFTAASSPRATRSSSVSGFGFSSALTVVLGVGKGGAGRACATDADGSALGVRGGCEAVGSDAEVTAAAANAVPSATNSTSGVTKLHSGTSPPAKRTRCARAAPNDGKGGGFCDGRGRTKVAALRAAETLCASASRAADACGGGIDGRAGGAEGRDGAGGIDGRAGGAEGRDGGGAGRVATAGGGAGNGDAIGSCLRTITGGGSGGRAAGGGGGADGKADTRRGGGNVSFSRMALARV